MSEKEILSALFDGQLDRDQARFALKRLERADPNSFDRYAVIGACLRKELVAHPVAGFSDRVLAALDTPALETSNKTSLWQWGAGMAVAASVAATALFFVVPATQQHSGGTLVQGQLDNPSLLKASDFRYELPSQRASNGSIQGQPVGAMSVDDFPTLQGRGPRPAGYNIVFENAPLPTGEGVPWEQTVVLIVPVREAKR